MSRHHPWRDACQAPSLLASSSSSITTHEQNAWVAINGCLKLWKITDKLEYRRNIDRISSKPHNRSLPSQNQTKPLIPREKQKRKKKRAQQETKGEKEEKLPKRKTKEKRNHKKEKQRKEKRTKKSQTKSKGPREIVEAPLTKPKSTKWILTVNKKSRRPNGYLYRQKNKVFTHCLHLFLSFSVSQQMKQVGERNGSSPLYRLLSSCSIPTNHMFDFETEVVERACVSKTDRHTTSKLEAFPY